jgi:hypothetical protein
MYRVMIHGDQREDIQVQSSCRSCQILSVYKGCTPDAQEMHNGLRRVHPLYSSCTRDTILLSRPARHREAILVAAHFWTPVLGSCPAHLGGWPDLSCPEGSAARMHPCYPRKVEGHCKTPLQFSFVRLAARSKTCFSDRCFHSCHRQGMAKRVLNADRPGQDRPCPGGPAVIGGLRSPWSDLYSVIGVCNEAKAQLIRRRRTRFVDSIRLLVYAGADFRRPHGQGGIRTRG